MISFVLSFILVLNQGWVWGAPPKAPASFQLNFEKKLGEATAKWNQAKTYEAFVNLLPSSKSEKNLLKKLLKERGMLRNKPVSAEFRPHENRFVLHFKEGDRSVWLLSVAPTLVAYDGKKVTEILPRSTLHQIVADHYKTKDNSPIKPSKKGAWWWRVAVNEAQAQIYSNEQIMAMEKYNQELAQQQTDLAQNILLWGGIAFGGFLVGGWLWNRYAHHLNPNWGSVGNAKQREERMAYEERKREMKDGFGDLEAILFTPESRLQVFQCVEPGKPSPVKSLRFSDGSPNGKSFSFSDQKAFEQFLQSQDPYIERVKAVDKCCQTSPPCGPWLAKFIIDNPPPPAGSSAVVAPSPGLQPQPAITEDPPSDSESERPGQK